MKATTYTKETIMNVGIVDRGFPAFEVGDTIVVNLKIKEGDKERFQLFQGDVIAIRQKGIASSFIVRKIGAGSVAVERIIPFNSPLVESIKIVRHGRVRRAKLYYLRNRVGRSARVREQVLTKEQKIAKKAKENSLNA